MSILCYRPAFFYQHKPRRYGFAAAIPPENQVGFLLLRHGFFIRKKSTAALLGKTFTRPWLVFCPSLACRFFGVLCTSGACLKMPLIFGM